MASSPTSSPTFHTPIFAPPLYNNSHSSSSSSKPGPHSTPLPTYRPGQPFMTWPDLHARYSPPGSPRLGMPSVQRPLSNEDLRHRFQSQTGNRPRNQRLLGQNLPVFSNPAPASASSSSSRSLSHSSRSSSSSPRTSIDQPIKQSRLSAKLPDPPVFSGTDKKHGFDEWKMAIQDKLTHNGDHYPSESFKIAYVSSRISGEPLKHISFRRRNRPYSRVDEMLDYLSDLYETPLATLEQDHSRAYSKLKQQEQQPFKEFYVDFMKYTEHMRGDEKPGSLEKYLVHGLRKRLSSRLRKAAVNWSGLDDTLSGYKQRLLQVEYSQQWNDQERLEKKTKAFAEQYTKAKAESEANRAIPRGILKVSRPVHAQLLNQASILNEDIRECTQMIGLKDVPMEPEDLWEDDDDLDIPKPWIDESGCSSCGDPSLSDDKLNMIERWLDQVREPPEYPPEHCQIGTCDVFEDCLETPEESKEGGPSQN